MEYLKNTDENLSSDSSDSFTTSSDYLDRKNREQQFTGIY